MRYLVTGASGFVGRHVMDLLATRETEVVGLSRGLGGRGRDRPPDVVHCDLTQEVGTLTQAVGQFRPDTIIHLAGVSVGRAASSQPWEVIHHNLLSTLNLLTACGDRWPDAKVLVTSSSAVYGNDPESRRPIAEECRPAPLTVYGVSKVAVEALAMQHYQAYGLQTIIVRPFNITGPGEHASFVTSAFARQLASIEAGNQEAVLRVGNLQPTRDFTDVRDAAKALVALARLGQPGETYNLCSGIGVTISGLLDLLLQLSSAKVSVTPDRNLMRPVEIQSQVGDPAKLKALTGWEPSYSLEETLRDVLEDWRTRVRE